MGTKKLLQPLDYQYLKKQYGLHWQRLMLLLKTPNHGYITDDDMAVAADTDPELTDQCSDDLVLELEDDDLGFVVLVNW